MTITLITGFNLAQMYKVAERLENEWETEEMKVSTRKQVQKRAELIIVIV